MLPAGARHARFLDRRRGVAVGRTLAEVWTTGTGGARWERRAARREVSDAAITDYPRCNEEACVVTTSRGAVLLRTF